VDPSDSELVDRVRSGDRDAARHLVERFQRRLLGVVVAMVRNPDDAREVVQETFVRAFRNLDGFKGDSSFYTWLYRIAVNQAIDLQRRESKRPTVEFDESLAVGGDTSALGGKPGGEDPFVSVRNRELGRKIFDAIDSLTADHRAVILLREIEGLSYEEISETLGCSLGTVMSRLHYARKKLQVRLKDLL
jgi:RNA polymerase sigma-70 factor (ECF subfamily)